MSYAAIVRTIEALRAKKTTRREILETLQRENPAYSEDELRRFMAMVPTRRVREAARPVQRALLALLVAALLYRLVDGASLVAAGGRLGWIAIVPVAFLGYTANLVRLHRYEAFVFCLLIVLGTFQGLVRGANAHDELSPFGPVLAVAIGIAGFVWRQQTFPTLDWRGRVKTEERD